MDAELKAVLASLVDGQAKLSESMAQLAKSQLGMAQTLTRLEQAQERLDKRQERFDKRQDHFDIALESLGKRLDAFNETVLRGFTDSVARDHNLQRRVDELEARLTVLEQARQ